MLLKDNKSEIKSIISNKNLLTSLEERFCYSQDSCNIISHKTISDYVVFPESYDDIAKILRFANKCKIPVICRGAGTNMVGACTCPNGGIVLNFSKLNKILEFKPDNMTVKVQPGVVLGDLKDFVAKEGLFFPPDPSNFKVSTIGGAIAQSSGGPMSFKYGTIKDYILSLTVMLYDGNIVKLGAGTIKDATGYHLNQLIVGSEGTLAIVLEAELKLIPKPETNSLTVAYFESIENATFAVNQIIKSGIFPATIDFMDNNSIATVENFYPCNLDTSKEALLMIELDGFKTSMNYQIKIVEDVLKNSNASKIVTSLDKKEIDAMWIARRSSFAAAAKLAPDVISDDIIVPRENLAKMVRECKAICNKYGLQVCIVGHVGDGNIHPQIALNLENEKELINYKNAKNEIYDMVIMLNGTISAEHGIGFEKQKYFDKIVDEKALEYMRFIKKLFDPNNILNPNKIFELGEL